MPASALLVSCRRVWSWGGHPVRRGFSAIHENPKRNRIAGIDVRDRIPKLQLRGAGDFELAGSERRNSARLQAGGPDKDLHGVGRDIRVLKRAAGYGHYSRRRGKRNGGLNEWRY